MTYTKGNWEFCRSTNMIFANVENTDNVEHYNVCKMEMGWNDTEDNAALISAAPELLEALKLMVDRYTPLYEEGLESVYFAETHPIIIAQAAIKKAEGGK